MKRKNALLLIVALLLSATLACSLFDGGDTASPLLVAGEQDAKILFRDDFSDASSGWDRDSVDDGTTDYENGQYRFLVNVSDTDAWANPGLNFSDVVVEVDATKAGGPDDNDFGIICRYQDGDNFYFFINSSDGYYAIGKALDGAQQLIGVDKMNPSDAIHQGKATNHIRADCVHNHLVLHVNGKQLFDVQDDSFASGDVGLMAGTFDEGGADILFDNFVVREP